MLYKSRQPTAARNTGRNALVQAMTQRYEATAVLQQQAALDAANFQAVYYQRLYAGTPCTCITPDDPLRTDGTMAPDTMSQVLLEAERGGAANGVILHSYNSSYEELHPELDLPNEGEELDQPDDELDYGKSFSDITPTMTGNCPVCNRTGWIGGYARWGGCRLVWAVPHWMKAVPVGGHFDHESSPDQVVAEGDRACSVSWDDALPRNPQRVASLRAMNGDTESPGWRLLVDGQPVYRPRQLMPYCDGQVHHFELQFNGTLTHFELETVNVGPPLVIDEDNWSRAATSSGVNNLDSLSATLPPTINPVRRGDVIFTRSEGAGWMLTGSTALRSSGTLHGWTVTLDRLSSRYDNLTLPNPYAGRIDVPV